MKNGLLIVAAIAILISVGGVRAEDRPAGADPTVEKKNEHVLDAMTQLLSLSKDQQTSVKAVLDDQSAEQKEAQKEFAERQKKIQDGADQKINALLTDDQKAKYPDVKAQLEKEEREKEAKSKKSGAGDSTGAKGDASKGAGQGRHGHHGGSAGGSPGGGIPN